MTLRGRGHAAVGLEPHIGAVFLPQLFFKTILAFLRTSIPVRVRAFVCEFVRRLRMATPSTMIRRSIVIISSPSNLTSYISR